MRPLRTCLAVLGYVKSLVALLLAVVGLCLVVGFIIFAPAGVLFLAWNYGVAQVAEVAPVSLVTAWWLWVALCLVGLVGSRPRHD